MTFATMLANEREARISLRPIGTPNPSVANTVFLKDSLARIVIDQYKEAMTERCDDGTTLYLMLIGQRGY